VINVINYKSYYLVGRVLGRSAQKVHIVQVIEYDDPDQHRHVKMEVAYCNAEMQNRAGTKFASKMVDLEPFSQGKSKITCKNCLSIIDRLGEDYMLANMSWIDWYNSHAKGEWLGKFAKESN
jgi:hypothetical protein